MNHNILLVDIGNSRIKWFWHSPATPTQPHSEPEALPYTSDWLLLLTKALQKHPSVAPARCLISNVADTTKRQAVYELVKQQFPLMTIEVVRPQSQHNHFQLNYDPDKMGTDRYLQLLGAQSLAANKRHLVISAGTATTIDGVQNNGRHIGGMIIPSVHLMRSSLHQYTAQLPASGGNLTQHAPNTTLDALDTGARLAQIGAILAFVTHFMSDAAEEIIVCGGGAIQLISDLQPHFNAIQHAPALCLYGLSKAI